MTTFGATFERKQKVSSLKMYIHTFSSESLVAAPWLKSCTEERLQQDKTSCSIHQASHPGASARSSRRSRPFRVKTSLEFICEQGWDRLCQGMLQEAQLQALLPSIPCVHTGVSQNHRVQPVADPQFVTQSTECHVQGFLGDLQGWGLQNSLGSPIHLTAPSA